MVNMRKMQQDEFDELTKNISEAEKRKCKHTEIVKIYFLGANTDYGCVGCGMEHTSLEAFRGNE